MEATEPWLVESTSASAFREKKNQVASKTNLELALFNKLREWLI